MSERDCLVKGFVVYVAALALFLSPRPSSFSFLAVQTSNKMRSEDLLIFPSQVATISMEEHTRHNSYCTV